MLIFCDDEPPLHTYTYVYTYHSYDTSFNSLTFHHQVHHQDFVIFVWPHTIILPAPYLIHVYLCKHGMHVCVYASVWTVVVAQISTKVLISYDCHMFCQLCRNENCRLHCIMQLRTLQSLGAYSTGELFCLFIRRTGQ